MGVTVDVAYKSLNKFTEILCGDKVEILQTADSNIMILADGMGSGVKANILATLTSKILGTMFLNGATLEECVETIVETLPICQVRQVAYATFSILQVFHSGEAYLVEFDNPGCIFIRGGKLMMIPQNIREVKGKKINEYRFQVQKGDALILMSDGTIHAGVGRLLNFGWVWEDIAAYAGKLREMGAVNVLVSMAKDGAILVAEDGSIYRQGVARGTVRNSVGAGDSMVAGFIAGYLATGDYRYALKLGTACGGATAFSDGIGTKQDIMELMETL